MGSHDAPARIVRGRIPEADPLAPFSEVAFPAAGELFGDCGGYVLDVGSRAVLEIGNAQTPGGLGGPAQ